MAVQRDKQCDSVHSSIVDIETRLDGKHAVEIKALRNAVKTLNLEHKVEIAEKEKEIHRKEIQIKDKEIQILKLENENKMLKLKTNDVEGKQTEQKASILQKDANEFYMNTEDLFTKGIAKFFFGEELQTGFYNSYHEWFEVMMARLEKNIPFIFEKSVLVKVTCQDPAKEYRFYSGEKNQYEDQYTYLDIFNKGWTHDTTSVLILHPNLINKSIQMKESYKSGNYHRWNVNSIPEEYNIGKDSFFTILCLKNETKKI